MEMKEIYIAPEVEVLCFAPVEALANEFWNTWSMSGENGTGKLPGNASEEYIEGEGSDSELEGEG